MNSQSIKLFKETLSNSSKFTFNDGSIKKIRDYNSQMALSNSKEYFKKSKDLEQYSKVVDQETEIKFKVE